MENKELEKNIDRIAQYDKELANKILMTDISKSNISITKTQKDEYTLVYNNVMMHNPNGAADEANKILADIQNKNEENALRVIFGLGLGYLADEISNLKGKIIIYEPNLDILKFVFSIASIDAIYKENVFVCSDKTTLYNLVQKYTNTDSKLTISFLPAYYHLFTEELNSAVKTAQMAKGSHNALHNTILFSTPRAIENTFKNLKYIIKNPDISQLKDIYKDKTALCLSAGPSLRENIETIKNNQDKFVIFAVNPTIKLLQANDIKPDFIVNIEAGNTIAQFSTINPEEYCLITEAFCANSVASLKTKRTFNYISDENFINPWVRDCLNISHNLETKGTVSYTMLMSAFFMGFKRIILCGQDLAYKDGNCYAKGSQFEDLECIFDETQNKYIIRARDFDNYAKSFKNAQNNDETARWCANYNIDFLNKNMYTVKSQTGGKLPTQTGYAIFIEWFEQASNILKQERPEIELINSSTGGAQIEGFKNVPLEEIVKTCTPFEKIDISKFNCIYDTKKAYLKIKLLYDKLVLVKELIDDLIPICEKILKEIKIKKTITPNIEKMSNKYFDILEAILHTRKDNDLKYIVFYNIYKLAEIIKTDYFSDASSAKNALEDIIGIMQEAKVLYELYLKCLADC